MHSLIILSLIILYLAYLMQKVSYISLLITRARGFGRLGRLSGGRFGAVGLSYPSNGRLMDGRRAFGAACVRVRACFPVRAGVRGYAPTIFRARPIPAGLPSHSVRRICGGNRVGGAK